MTTKLKPIPLFGSGTAGKSLVVTSQRRLNCYYELRQDEDKTKVAIYGTPGMSPAFSIASTIDSPTRGIISTTTHFYAVAYNMFYEMNSAGAVEDHGTLNTIAGLVSLSFNPTQVVVVDGTDGWYYTIATDVWAQITDAAFPSGAQTIAFLNGFFICEAPNSGKFYVSSSNDGSTWNSLAFATASQYPDSLLACDTLAGMLVLFSEHHMEFWQNVGSTPEPFQYISNSANEYGLGAVFSRKHLDNSIIFLTQTREGGYQIAQLTGYTPRIISTPDIDSIINSFTTVSDAVALVYQADAHKFYQITFPSENRSLLFDTATQIWSETQSGVSSGYASRHIGNLSVDFNGKSYITDYSNGNVYIPDPNVYTDNGNPLIRKIVTRHTSNGFNRFRITSVYLDMETGVGLTTGQGADPQIMLRVSKDNGRTWSNERWVSLGKLGQYLNRVIWRRLGSARDFVLEISMSDPVKFVITQGAAVISRRAA